MTLLKDAGVPTPKFGVAKTASEAKTIAEELGGSDLVIKAQVYSISKQIFWKMNHKLAVLHDLMVDNDI